MTITFANYPVHWIGGACTTACRGLIQPAACSPAGAVCAVVLCWLQSSGGCRLLAPGYWLLAPGYWSRGQHSSCLVSGHSNHHLPRINCSGPAALLSAATTRCQLLWSAAGSDQTRTMDSYGQICRPRSSYPMPPRQPGLIA